MEQVNIWNDDLHRFPANRPQPVAADEIETGCFEANAHLVRIEARRLEGGRLVPVGFIARAHHETGWQVNAQTRPGRYRWIDGKPSFAAALDSLKRYLRTRGG